MARIKAILWSKCLTDMGCLTALGWKSVDKAVKAYAHSTSAMEYIRPIFIR